MMIPSNKRFSEKKLCDYCKYAKFHNDCQGVCTLKNKNIQWYESCRKYEHKKTEPRSM